MITVGQSHGRAGCKSYARNRAPNLKFTQSPIASKKPFISNYYVRKPVFANPASLSLSGKITMRVFILPTGFAVQKRPNISKSTCDFLTNKSKTTSSSSRVLTRRINSPTVLRRPFQGQHFSHSVNSCYIRPSFNSLATIYLCRGRTYHFNFSITYQLLPSSILTLHTPY